MKSASALRHFADLPVLEVHDIKQRNPVDNMLHFGKPKGLWVSDESSEQSWSNWCEAEQFGIGALEHLVDLAPGANILRIETLEQLDGFGARYGICPDHEYFRDEPAIQWADVERDFDGILITPYHWERRLHPGSSWYYGWDCASGCIWRSRAVSRIEPIMSPAQAADLIDARAALSSQNGAV